MKTISLLLALTTLLSAGAQAYAQAVAPQGSVEVQGPDGTLRASELPEGRTSVRVIGSDGTESSLVTPPASDVARYCSNIADPARDARVALQTQRLQELEAQVNARIDDLEAKRAEYQEWLEERQAFLDSASAIMLDIYAAMRPEAAAAQLAGLDRDAAAAIIAKLKSRQASAIMTEMPAPIASELASLIVQKTNRPADEPPAGSGARS